ncbi:chalcone isomerase family protein [Psychromonas aquatilis]|uniref:Chalcone isomerase family protein n=1 Tax=Psychromonas aquatilis TaxID=2005072 RepID=A0ABU9GRB4_9GAMM
MNKVIGIVIAIAIFLGNAVAKEVAQPPVWQKTLTNEVTKTDFKMVGNATFSYLLWDIYESYLSTPSGKFSFDENQDLLYKIQYLRNIKAADLVDETENQWQKIGLNKQQYTTYLSQLKSIWPDINKGDSLTLVAKGSYSGFYYNNTFIGQINDTQFAQVFMSIWLSNETTEPNIRKQLLGESNE